MSDSVKKWHEMQENTETRTMYPGDISITVDQIKEGKYIFESPDGGKTVTRRPFGGDIADREIIQHPERELQEIKKQAYTLLVNYDEEVIRMANKILDIG